MMCPIRSIARTSMVWLPCALFLALVSAPVHALTLYVAPNGNDTWSGTLASPNADASDGPFATPVGARDAVRRIKAEGGLTEPVEVLFADGVYELTEPLVLGPEDSGTESCPVTYGAMPDATPVVSGGRRIAGWKKGDGAVWTATVPEVRDGQWYFHQLFVNGRRATRARTPNEGYLRTDGPVEPLKDRGAARKDPSKKIAFRFVPGDIKKWENLDDVNVFVYHSWTSSLHWIADVNLDENIVKFAAPSGWPIGYWDLKQRYHLENYPEALDAPGEWYLDRGTGTVSYWPLDGEDMTKADVAAPKLGMLLRLDGDLEGAKYVEYVNFRGLSFQHADWILDKTATNDGQAAAFQNDAVLMLTGARHVAFENCELAHVGTYALWFREGTKDAQAVQCHIHDLGTGGIRIGEKGTAANDDRLTERVLVDNCWIHDGGHVFPAGHGVWIGRASHNTISHCEISDFYYTGVAIGWSWGYQPSTAHHNVVDQCHIHHIGKGVLSDMGTIYTLGLAPGTRLTNNLMHDVFSYSYGGWGLYNDEGSTGIVMENNVVYNTKTGGYHQHYGKENILRNNILAFSKEGQVIRSREEDHISFFCEGNIIVVDNGMPLGKNWKNDNFVIDRNLYWDVTGQEMDFAGWSLEEWQAKGFDTHSIIADPLFVDLDAHDFRLKPNSPAHDIGFKDIDMSKVGLYGAPEWTDGPKHVKRAALDLSYTMPLPATSIHDGFEDTAVGEAPKDGHCSVGGDQGVLAVTDETAAVGKQSLKFVDAAGLSQDWQPHLNYTLGIRSGVVRNSMYLRVEPGAVMYMEWRDWRNTPYKVGANFSISPQGVLSTRGKELMTVPQGKWFKIEIEAVVGAKSPHTFHLVVTVPGEDPREFGDLPFGNADFMRLTWFGFSSTAKDRQVFYVDELELALAPAE